MTWSLRALKRGMASLGRVPAGCLPQAIARKSGSGGLATKFAAEIRQLLAQQEDPSVTFS